MKQRPAYPNIDMKATGKKIKKMMESAGYTPKMIQEYLHLSCVQPIYRWYKGSILPSVDNLLMMSELLGVHMNDMLVKKMPMIRLDITRNRNLSTETHFYEYAKRIYRLVA